MGPEVAERRRIVERRSGTVDRRSHRDRRVAEATRPLAFPDRRSHHDRRSAYPDRRMRLFDRRSLPTVAAAEARHARTKGWAGLPNPLLPLLAIALLSLADVVTTARLTELGGSELNPVSGWLIDRGWLLAAKAVGVAALAILVTRVRPHRWIPLAMWSVAGVYAAVIALHVWQLATR